MTSSRLEPCFPSSSTSGCASACTCTHPAQKDYRVIGFNLEPNPLLISRR